MKITTHRHGLLSKLRLRLSGETGGDARVRTAVDVPLAFADGYETSARVFTFRGLGDGQEHLVLALGDWETAETPLVRIHSECLTGDVFGSARCDCGPQLREAVERIAEHGGFVIYMRQEGRGIGLYNKLDAYALQDAGLDTYEANIALGQRADGRDYTAAAQMLKALGHEQIDLLSNNPDKASQLEANGIAIRGRRTTGVFARPTNERYLLTKVLTTGHDMSLAAIHPAHA